VQQRAVERLGHLAGGVVADHPEREFRRVQDLDREAPTDLDLALVDGGVDARPPVLRPVAHGVGAVLLEQRHRGDDVALRLRHLLAVGIEDPAVDRCVAPRQRAVLVVRAQEGGAQPRSDDVAALWSQVRRERAGEQIGVLFPSSADLRRERRRCPRVHHVGVTDEPSGLAALLVVVAVGCVIRRVDGELFLARKERVRVVDLPVVAGPATATARRRTAAG
jgi:hypothetical protein